VVYYIMYFKYIYLFFHIFKIFWIRRGVKVNIKKSNVKYLGIESILKKWKIRHVPPQCLCCFILYSFSFLKKPWNYMPNLLIWQYPYKLDYGICAFIVKYILASYFDFGPLGVTVFLLKRTAFDLRTLR
jgi:hypothetical protein